MDKIGISLLLALLQDLAISAQVAVSAAGVLLSGITAYFLATKNSP